MASDRDKDFCHAFLPAQQKRVLRLGLAGNYGIEGADVDYAAERGVNYWLWSRRFKKVTPTLRRLLKQDRERQVVSVLDNVMLAGGPRRGVETALRELGTDYVDTYKLGWLGTGSRFSAAVQDTLLALRQEGKLRSIGCSIHDRRRAGALALESILDTFMIRYSAKHPGAEQDIFPSLAARNPTVVAYTATAWAQLLRPLKNAAMRPWPAPSGESAPPPLVAPLCYRFCLSNPHVHVVLSGPRNRAELEQNLDALEQGPLTEAELSWVRDYGALVKKAKRLDYV